MSTTPAGPAPVPETPDEADGPTPTTGVAATGTAPDAPSERPASRRLGLLALLLAALVLVADQLTKWWALESLTEGERIDLVGDLLGLTLVFNPGAALSFMANGYTWVLTIVVVAVVVVILRAMRRLGSRGWTVALGLLLGGAVGNLADRLFREPGFAEGHVVDMIAYVDFFVGNVADIAIVAAAGLIIVLTFRGIRLDGTRETDERD
ncbi:signal peptidase II [Isoptericola chiayiensis]|uniref:Lipoprotein signal peptidase n=1 Tax=Isoptericola chiayiensis TaxID=579446 RepID=A0ABP8YNG2_9MICO|nr:signal peptidase II [Isoptericola chiayiensis]NOW01574.1 signal peptidase II [Isoptericola chiayiensis]